MTSILLKKYYVYELLKSSSDAKLSGSQEHLDFNFGEKSIFLPYHCDYPIKIFCTNDKELKINDKNYFIRKIGNFDALKFYLRLIRIKISKNCLKFNDIFIIYGNTTRQFRNFGKLNRHFKRYEIGLDDIDVETQFKIFSDLNNTSLSVASQKLSNIAFLIHIYYRDTLIDFMPILNLSNDLKFDLIITTPHVNLIEDLESLGYSGLNIRIIQTENRGRDVYPFLSVLESGMLDKYDIVCKLHGKKSVHLSEFPFFGTLARRANLIDLVYKAGHFDQILKEFERINVGLIGPKRFFQKFDRFSDASFSKNNSCYIADLIDPNKVSQNLDFFAGTMFWFRPSALGIFKVLRLTERFEPEDGSIDGRLEHAIERIFNLTVRQAGFEVHTI